MRRTMAKLLIGPEHNGMQMSLDDFARAQVEPGYLYELEQGVIIVSDLADMPHTEIVHRVRRSFYAYDLATPGKITLIAGGIDSAIRMTEVESERHPDITVYLTERPLDDPQPWDCWTPDIVVEVVSKASRKRDCQVKPAEYLEAGVRLYLIVDPFTRSISVLMRRLNRWREQRLAASDTLTTRLLPGFALKLSDIFGAAPPLRVRKPPRRPRGKR